MSVLLKFFNGFAKFRHWEPKHYLMFAAIPSLFVLPPVQLLVWGGYPVLRTESLMLLGLALFVGLLLSLLLFQRPIYLRLAALATTVVGALMMNVHEQLGFLFPMDKGVLAPLLPLLAALIVVGVPGLLIIGLKDNGLVILGGIASAMLISTILFPQPAAPAVAIHGDLPTGNQQLPPILHLVMDEHAAISQLPGDMVAEISILLEDFRLYPDAYSPFSFTPYAMTATLNPDLKDEEISPDSLRNRWLIEPNAWFEHLTAKGYVISVHQPHLLDYCLGGDIVDRCYTYNAFSVGYLADLEFPIATKLKLLINYLMPWLQDLHDFPIYLWPTAGNRAVDDAALLLEKGARGRAFFMHFTTPHGPFIYDRNCQQQGNLETWNSVTSYENLLNEYHGQMRCAWRQIERLLLVLKENDEWKDAIILLHGDHGLRFFLDGKPDPARDPDRVVAASELMTLLTVRHPTLAPGTQPGRIEIPRALNALMGTCAEQADSGVGYTVPREDFRNKLRTQAPIQLQLPPIGPALVPVCTPTR